MRPPSWTPVLIPAFFSAWLTNELAPQLLVLLGLTVAAFALLGGVDGGLGVLGLALAVAQAVGLVVLVRRSERAADVADEALAEVPDIGNAPGGEPASGLRRFFVPMAFRHPDVERLVDVRYSEEHPRHRLDVYRRKDAPAGCPTLLQVHGGGWAIGDKREQGRPLMLALAARGWVCFAPNYRLSPRATFPDHLVDVKRALAWVREHGHEYGADPGFLVLTGGSAGGHLVALAALTPNDPAYQPGFEHVDTTVQGCVPYYGVYDLAGETGTRAAELRSKRLLEKVVFKTRDRERFREASPLSHVRADAPPFFVIHGRNDTLVPV
ncbi:MAG: alpha/beta hydrolase, partial [Frankiales bacterium]